MAKDQLTSAEAAKELGVTRQRVNQLIRANRLPAERLGNLYVIKRADLAKVKERPTGRPPKEK